MYAAGCVVVVLFLEPDLAVSTLLWSLCPWKGGLAFALPGVDGRSKSCGSLSALRIAKTGLERMDVHGRVGAGRTIVLFLDALGRWKVDLGRNRDCLRKWPFGGGGKGGSLVIGGTHALVSIDTWAKGYVLSYLARFDLLGCVVQSVGLGARPLLGVSRTPLAELLHRLPLSWVLMIVEMVVYSHLGMIDDLERPQGVVRRRGIVFVARENRTGAGVHQGLLRRIVASCRRRSQTVVLGGGVLGDLPNTMLRGEAKKSAGVNNEGISRCLSQRTVAVPVVPVPASFL